MGDLIVRVPDAECPIPIGKRIEQQKVIRNDL